MYHILTRPDLYCPLHTYFLFCLLWPAVHESQNEDAENNAMVLAALLKGLLKYRDSLVSILLKNAIFLMSQQEYPMQDDEVNRCTHTIQAPKSAI